MKNLIALLLLFVMSTNLAMAECDFATGIVRQDDNHFVYTRECHLRVGQMTYDLVSAYSQINDYKKAIELKDLALTKSEQRADMWMNTSFTLQDRMKTIEDYKSKNETLYFVGGILLTGLSVWAAGQLVHH